VVRCTDYKETGFSANCRYRCTQLISSFGVQESVLLVMGDMLGVLRGAGKSLSHTHTKIQEKTPRVALAKGDTGATETLAAGRHQSSPSPVPPPGEAAERSPCGRRRRRGGYSQFAGASRRGASTGIGGRPRKILLPLAAVDPLGSPMAAAELGLR
jgi:hypothetical protein